VGAGAGVNWLQGSDADIPSVTTPNAARRASIDFDLGFGGVISLGWGFGNGVRAEIEGNFRQNDVDSVSVAGIPRVGQGGTARSYGVMGNALYDFGAVLGLPVQPYLGVGIGYVIHEYDNVNIRSDFGGPGGTSRGFRIDDSEGRFAYQAIVGAALPLDTVTPGLALTAEYRFFATLSPELEASSFGFGSAARTKGEVDNLNHSIFLGVRYAFNAAPPPPPPAAAPQPARTYLVFFDWNRADLTDRARQIIAEAAQNARRVQTTRIELAGHADRTGSFQYNQRLSERRAENVAAELVRLGIPRNEITTQGFSYSRPLVPTAAGVREPQNRRVEIVLR
jgi:outer membrane protein OmpA-like peptidoglycan-associated protein